MVIPAIVGLVLGCGLGVVILGVRESLDSRLVSPGTCGARSERPRWPKLGNLNAMSAEEQVVWRFLNLVETVECCGNSHPVPHRWPDSGFP